MLISSFFKINHNLNLNRKNLRFRLRQKVIKAKNDNARAKSCMIEKNVNTFLNLSNHQIANAINQQKNN
jgi:regulator of replication initiation timing